MVITESWLCSQISDELIRIPGYVTYRKDRSNNQRGGGLCTYISSRLNVIELGNLCEPEIETQWFLIKLDRLPRGINSIVLGTVYHPPQGDDRILLSHIFNSLDSLLATYPNSAIMLLGDFNQFKPANLCSSFKLKKLVTKPTRGNNILDQAFSTLLPYYESIILPPVASSDHSSVLLQPTGKPTPSLPTMRFHKRDSRASNKRHLIVALENFNWTPIMWLNSCEHQLEAFQTVIDDAIDSYLPIVSVKKHPNDKPWITPLIKDTIKKRQQAWVKNDSQKYKVYRNKVIKLCKKARHRFFADKISHTHDTDPHKWWDGIKMLSGLSKTPPITSITVNDTILRDVDLAELISESFSRVTDDLSPLAYTPIPVLDVPDEYIISSEAVEHALSVINERKSVGPDKIPNWVIKDCASIISNPVCSIFNSSIREGHVPKLWKSAEVLPLAKTAQPQSIDSDLRPISLTPVISKVLEGFVFNWIARIVMPHIDPYQFGSVKRSSTTHALVHLLHNWLSALEEPNTFIRTCMIDFSKAFDRIDHNILIDKLRLLNVPPVLLNWCASFLRQRQQRVKLQNCTSNWRTINAGVPQGTKLGPLFFLIMVNDLVSQVPLYKYVDDSALSEVVRVGELSTLQTEVDRVNHAMVNCEQYEFKC